MLEAMFQSLLSMLPPFLLTQMFHNLMQILQKADFKAYLATQIFQNSICNFQYLVYI